MTQKKIRLPVLTKAVTALVAQDRDYDAACEAMLKEVGPGIEAVLSVVNERAQAFTINTAAKVWISPSRPRRP